MARFCTNCGQELAEGVAFCTSCGTKAPENEVKQSVEAPKQMVSCQKCGAALPDGVAFCTECGTARSGEPSAPPVAPVKQEAQIPRQQAYVPPVHQPTPSAQDPQVKPVGTGTFFGLQFLFSIPVIGWLVCLIMTFAPKNKSLKNYARAMLIWLLIGLVLGMAIFFLFRWVGGILTSYITEITDGAFAGWNGLFDQFGNIGELFDQLSEGSLDGLPKE